MIRINLTLLVFLLFYSTFSCGETIDGHYYVEPNTNYQVSIKLEQNCVYSNILDDNFFIRYTKNKYVNVQFNANLNTVNYAQGNIVDIPIADLIRQKNNKPTPLLTFNINRGYTETKNSFKIGVIRVKPNQNPSVMPILEGDAFINILVDSPYGIMFKELPFSSKTNEHSSRLYCTLNHSKNNIIYACSCMYEEKKHKDIINFN